jgi:DNA modification methylase
MKEIKDKSIDFIFTSPPYNLETKYDGFKDSLSFKDYKKMLSKIICECSRVIKNNSLFIVEVADSVIFKNKYVLLAGLIQSICLKNSFFLAGRYINFINTNHKVEIPDHNIKKDFSNNGNAHSNCH